MPDRALLTLNVLLSFAQFEREVTGERIRDKSCGFHAQGHAMGGPVPLGYDVKDKKLVINPEEAERVRTIFRQYLKLKSIIKLLEHLRRRKILTKRTARSGGSVRGGISFSKGALAFLLKNRVYIGEIVHKGKLLRKPDDTVVSQEGRCPLPLLRLRRPYTGQEVRGRFRRTRIRTGD